MTKTALDSAISSWKQGHEGSHETLSEVARSRILARARDRTRQESPLRTLFFPLRRLVLAGAMPLVLLTVMIGYVAQQTPDLKNLETTPIFASKSAGEVIFTIANGDRAHTVHFSTAPDRFENAPALVTRDGAFRDSLNEGPDLVYYRID